MTRSWLMPVRVGIIERAFQLAGSGNYAGLNDLASQLHREGYIEVEEHIACPLLRQQLRTKTRHAVQAAASEA